MKEGKELNNIGAWPVRRPILKMRLRYEDIPKNHEDWVDLLRRSIVKSGLELNERTYHATLCMGYHGFPEVFTGKLV